jgi:hypothetical protein
MLGTRWRVRGGLAVEWVSGVQVVDAGYPLSGARAGDGPRGRPPDTGVTALHLGC